jgi:predicted metal-dependent hydrolase
MRTESELKALLNALSLKWAMRLDERGIGLKLKPMKSIWGSCHYVKRIITYNTELTKVPDELVEYIVVHEMTHFKAHDHGPEFRKLMDKNLPQWRSCRHRLKEYA